MDQKTQQDEILQNQQDPNSIDYNWKQDLQLNSDDEQQLIQFSEQEQDDGSNSFDHGEIQFKEFLLPLDLKQDESIINTLLYMDEPCLQIFVSGENLVPALLQCFLPQVLSDLFLKNVNYNLQLIIRRDYPNEQQFESIYTKKKFSDNEIQQYLGMLILFGILQFPLITHYWNNDSLMLGGIESCMQEGRYKFIDNNIMNYSEIKHEDKAKCLVDRMRQKWRRIYRPDQELILFYQKTLTYSIHYLLDSETLYILDQMITLQGQEQPLLKMLLQFANKNHVLYFSPDSLDIRLIIQLAEHKIYAVGEFSSATISSDQECRLFLDQFQNSNSYSNNSLCFKKYDDKLFTYPKGKIKQEVEQDQSLQEQYQQQLNFALARSEEKIFNAGLYKNPHSYTADLLNRQICDDFDEVEKKSEIQMLHLMFEETFEKTIHNMFTVQNMINNQQKQCYKIFRLVVASALIGEKYKQLENDRIEIIRKLTLVTCTTQQQTDQLDYGLPPNLRKEDYHQPVFVERHLLVKYCVVCMKYENLSKSYFHCIQCQKQINNRVFLCLFPCFELFHKNPVLYVICDQNLMLGQKDNIYFHLDYSVAARQIMDQEYKTKNEFTPSKIEYNPPVRPINGRQHLHQGSSQIKRLSDNSRIPLAKLPPTFYNWSYNRGFRYKGDEDLPIERDFEDLINNRNQKTTDLLRPPKANKHVVNPTSNRNQLKIPRMDSPIDQSLMRAENIKEQFSSTQSKSTLHMKERQKFLQDTNEPRQQNNRPEKLPSTSYTQYKQAFLSSLEKSSQRNKSNDDDNKLE